MRTVRMSGPTGIDDRTLARSGLSRKAHTRHHPDFGPTRWPLRRPADTAHPITIPRLRCLSLARTGHGRCVCGQCNALRGSNTTSRSDSRQTDRCGLASAADSDPRPLQLRSDPSKYVLVSALGPALMPGEWVYPPASAASRAPVTCRVRWLCVSAGPPQSCPACSMVPRWSVHNGKACLRVVHWDYGA